MEIKEITFEDCKKFLAKNNKHGFAEGDFYFGIFNPELVGAFVFARHNDYYYTLKRFALVDELPKNSESKAIALALNEMRKLGAENFITFTPENENGSAYKAVGFIMKAIINGTKCYYLEANYGKN